MNDIYDLIIIGSGPAGITSGIYAARREMKTLIIGKELGGQVIWASDIENYPGIKKIGNFEFISKLQEHVSSLGVNIQNAEVQTLIKEGDFFTLHTSKDEYHAKTVIIAMGLAPSRLAIPGEERLTGRGVSYCANCDGPFYRDKLVAVVGGGNSALDAAEVIAKVAKKVYLIHRKGEFKAFEALVSEVEQKENIEILLNSELKEITGELKVESIKIVNNSDNSEKKINVDGVFIEIGRIAHTDLVKNLVERNEKNQIIADKLQMTKTPGLFAAGDVVESEFKQLTIAMGKATTAALAAYQYIQLKEGGKKGPVQDRSFPKI